MIELDDGLKEQLIVNRLKNLSRQHFETQLDLLQANAIGQTEAISQIQKRLDDIQASYNAIEALLTTPNAPQ